jgi:transposase
MAQYTINSDYGSIFGLDVHARSIVARGFDFSTGEIKVRRFASSPTAQDLLAWMEKHFTKPYYAAYESGCTGFHLCRQLRSAGVDSDVIAVSSIARSADDKQRKTDKVDAKRLLAELLLPSPSCTAVWVPDSECEAARDLARARADAMSAGKRSKQQLTALLLRHGYVWDEKTPTGKRKTTWSSAHLNWIKGIDLGEEAANEALRFYLMAVRQDGERIAGLDALIGRYANTRRFKPYVDAISLIKGISINTAFLLAAEIGDFSRFANGRSVSKWLGSVPSESSSDEHIRHGHITKAGNVHCRTALVECAQVLVRASEDPKKPRVGQDASDEVRALCTEATRRLKARYRHLTAESKKHTNKAKMAVVNELIRWVWLVGLSVQRQQGRPQVR